MPLVAHSQLPTFDQLRVQGQDVLSLKDALHQDIRELNIGLLNMMPDAALQATERQFMRLIGSCNQIAQFYIHPFSIPGLARGKDTQDYINNFYTSFESVKKQGLDALIITGANVASPMLEQQPFWHTLKEVISWATENVASVLCSCLSTHALVKHLYNIDRYMLPQKLWGVYSHRITQVEHPVLRDINTRFDVPQSRYNTLLREQLEKAGLKILVESLDGGVNMAVSPDNFRIFFLQGHPEYDSNSLLKEYKREILLFLDGKRPDYPPSPENYFSPEAQSIAEQYKLMVFIAKEKGTPIPPFPEQRIEPYLDNTWRDTGKAIFNNWLGLVYQKTAFDHPHPLVRPDSSGKTV
ncbi:MAG: homoserine O-succinyltransferase [SAR324 cluster bacterium]|nr:homoserine O-succinyltransferase [SAR324 cluster bacterium]